jgi:4-alpha-glucanotransferase
MSLKPAAFRSIYERFCKPYITDAVLQHFWQRCGNGKANFFKSPCKRGRYELQETFDTQKKVEAYFAEQEGDMRI